MNLDKVKANLAQAKANQKRMATQIQQLKQKKEKASKDAEYRAIDNQIKTENNEITKLTKDAQFREKKLKTEQKIADDNRRAGASAADLAILDQISELKEKHGELVAEREATLQKRQALKQQQL